MSELGQYTNEFRMVEVQRKVTKNHVLFVMRALDHEAYATESFKDPQDRFEQLVSLTEFANDNTTKEE